MKNFPKAALLASALMLLAGLGGGYWYVFIAGAPQLDAPPAEANTGLEFQVEQFGSEAMGSDRAYGIVLPPNYNTQPQRHYPVIILLHGGHGSERDYEDKARLTSILHDLYQRDRLPYSIVVTPDGNDNRGSSPLFDQDYFDGPNGSVATLISQDLVRMLKSRYRTLNQPQFWAIGGISSGAYGAFNIGLRHLNTFHLVFGHTGYFSDRSGAYNSPQVFVAQLPPQQRRAVRIYLDAGDADHKYLEATQTFHNTLNQLGIVNEFHVFPGGHGILGKTNGWNYWHTHLADSLSFVGKYFKQALAQQKSPVKPHSQSHSQSHVQPRSTKSQPQSHSTTPNHSPK